MRLVYKLAAGLSAVAWIFYFSFYFSIPRPKSVIQVSRWLKKTVHVINLENTNNAVNSVQSQGSRDSPTPRTPVFAKPLTPQSMAQFLRLHNDGVGGQGPTQAAQRPRGQVASGRHTTPNPYQTLLEKANGYFLKNGGGGASVSPQFQADLVKDIPQLTDVQADAFKAFLDYAQQNAVYNPDGQVHNNGLGPGPAMFANLLQNPHSVPTTPGPLSSGNSLTSHIDNMANTLLGNDGQTLQRMLETQNLLANNAVGAENNAVASSWGGLQGQMFPAKSNQGGNTAENQGGSLLSHGGNIPSPDGNIPSPGGSIPSPGGNIPSPDGNIPSPDGNIPSPDGKIPSPDGNIPSLGGNIPSLGGNIPSPGGNILSPDGNVLSPGRGLPSTDRNLPYLSGSIAFPVRKILSPGGRFLSLGSMEYGPEHLQTQENQNLTNIYSVFHEQFLPLYFRSKGMLAIEGLGKRTLLTLTEEEKRYLATPALTDIAYIPDVLKSKVR
ncbi:hypothetical protein V1264_015304 [Littorina saxatilis]|uniref:Uncharacterized protein n=1 Tax=Littorina saxatilis TaxID=31220 RepID=A0AAN9BPR1_9CAEN